MSLSSNKYQKKVVMDLLSNAVFDALFALQGSLIAVLIFMKTMTIARKDSPFRMSDTGQKLFLLALVGGAVSSQLFVILASYSDPSQVSKFLSKSYPSMKFLLRYKFLWILTTNRNFVGFITSIFICIGLVFMVMLMSYIVLLFELDLQVNSMSRSTNKYQKKVVRDFLVHLGISLPFYVLTPLFIFVKFFLNDDIDVSVLTTLFFAFFVSAPIPSMLVFLLRNPVYRTFLITEFRIPVNKTPAAKTTNSRQTPSRVQME
ncbi:Protein CBG27001 [Caenorhabditis briggsae]|uniref:Protein CBG27001 n=1 Tax=Caenorhabditis briggsae TaxID=6238 RepID=B6IIF8_CAEBR|nr:Protein CBG27001 [Caenorhabditis briggsae]CAR99688.1 Protein CBG27001 [Caenorhabditis briggsae]